MEYTSALEREAAEVQRLEKRIEEETPERGAAITEVKSFNDFPISQNTYQALKNAKFVKPTEIQSGSIPHALAGRDILAAAKTGSGKTIAFLVPILEALYRNRWDTSDGLGAMVISPTRELALQIFEVLRSIGKQHTFSAGLIIGGKNFNEEQFRIVKMNILICTPGRLLQHLEQTPGFDTGSLLVLCLDEADRILDMGFSKQLSSILSYLPTGRQTMLFSATQTKSVKDLARLSLNEPEYVAVHEKSEHATPASLTQNYIVCNLEKKLDVLYSFIKTHLKQKTIVFVSTCRQVRFMYEAFCKTQPGVPLMSLHGKHKQAKRVEIYYEFLNKPAAVLFATDIAARGLDFPAVDWVFQFDCPEDTANYIHRAGRTARYNRNGRAMTLLVPSEAEGMAEEFSKARIPIEKIKVNPKKTFSCQQKFASLVASDKDMKSLAQKAFMSYVRSVNLQPNKAVFNPKELPLQEYAVSLGLACAPRVNFLKCSTDRQEAREKKNVNHKLQNLKDRIKAEKARKRLAKKLEAAGGLAPPATVTPVEKDVTDDESSDLMVVKQVHHWDKDEEGAAESHDSVVPRKKAKIRVNDVSASKIVFDDSGKAMDPFEKFATQAGQDAYVTSIDQLKEGKEAFAERVASRLESHDSEDRKLERERVRAKHTKKRLKKKGLKSENDSDDDMAGPRLGGFSDDDAVSASDNDSSNNDVDDGSVVDDEERLALRMLESRNK